MITSCRTLKPLLLFCLTLLLSWGCSYRLPSSNLSQNSSSVSSDCRAITHDAGQTEVCGQPLTIVALSPYILDMMLALGVEPAGYAAADVTGDLLRRPKFDNPGQQIPYLGSQLNNQPVNLGDRHGLALEAIAKLQPDLILGEGWQGTQSKYALLSKIAPTVLVDDEQGGWEHSIDIIGQALDKSEQLQQVKADYDVKVMTARDQLAPAAREYPQVLLLSSGNLSEAIYSYDNSEFSRLLERLNFQLVGEELFSENSVVSLEVIPQSNADIVVVVAWNDADKSDTRGWERLQQEWSKVPLLAQMPASQAGRVFFLDARLSTIRGPLAAEAILDSYVSFFAPLN